MAYIMKDGVRYCSSSNNSDVDINNISNIINQATNTWVMPDYMKDRDTNPYNCGMGTPEDNGYSADDYNDENGWDEPYLDIVTGTVYYGTRIQDSPLTYGWVEKEQLVSVQTRLNEVFTSVSNGKSLIASAITDKGVETDANDSFLQMATNVSFIRTGVNYAGVSIGAKVDTYTLIEEG